MGLFQNRKPDRDRGAFSKFTHESHAPSVEFHATFYHEQAESGARAGFHIASAMERLEQVLVIFTGDTDSLVTNDADRVHPIPLNRETHGRSGL